MKALDAVMDRIDATKGADAPALKLEFAVILLRMKGAETTFDPIEGVAHVGDARGVRCVLREEVNSSRGGGV